MKKSNVRVLTKTVVLVSLLAPASGHALGIGEIKLHSALNQNLDAEISLTLSGESASDIKVKFAPPEKFNEAGVSWTYFLSKIKFETITQANGSAVIKLTSNEALKEPFLDFLLEVSWPKGNLYREFTVLVDPPAVYNQATVPASTSTNTYAQSPVVNPQRPAYANEQISEGEYGPTLANDTLWSVAERARGQGDVSVEQMMIAIYQANPQAFYKGNVHALTAGKILTIPEREAVLKLSRSQALAEFNRHNKAWKNHSAPERVETVKAKPVPSKVEGAVDNQLTLVAPTKEVDVSSETPKTVDVKPALVAVEGAKQGASSAVQVDGGIQNKVAELEKQLAMMQELIALKDQQLAAMQNQSLAKPLDQNLQSPGEATLAKPSAEASSVLQQPVQVKPSAKPTEVTLAPPKVALQPVVQTEPETDALYYLGVAGAGSVILTLLGWLWWRKRKVDEQTNTESMFASSSLIQAPDSFTQSVAKDEEGFSVPDGGEVAADIHDLGTVGESSFLSEFTPSDFDSFDTDQGEIDPISEADVYLAYGRYQQAEELIRQAIKDQPKRDECKLKLLEIFYANEDKAAFEKFANELVGAGKHKEVGFWEKASEMGRDICADSPLFSSGSDSVVDAPQASEDFDLNSFSIDTRESDGADQDVKAVSAQTGQSLAAQAEHVDFELSSFSMESDQTDQGVIAASSKTDKASESEIESIDFDLSSFSMESDQADQGVIAANTKAGKSAVAQVEDIDFDLSSFSMESDQTDQGVIAANAKAGKSVETQLEDIDFDLSSFSMDSKESDEMKELQASGTSPDVSSEINVVNKEQEFESYEFDFSVPPAEKTGIDDLDFSALENVDNTHQDSDFSADRSLDLNDDLDGDFDFNFDLDFPVTDSGQGSGQHDEFSVSDLTDMDELETKLDLAKAYVDMGDADAAKDLAREVLEQGTAEQQKVAQALLDELG
ncbi:MAG: FimV/HubP family polar landmark protein [Methylococcaceae bacterium]